MKRALAVALLLLCGAMPALAGTVNLAWDAPASGSPPTGYEVHYGLSSGNYTVSVDTGTARTASIGGLADGQAYYFAALAYNSVGDSAYSNEVSAIPGSQPPGDTAPPVVSITSPTGPTVQRRATVTITAQASDNVGVVRVEFSVNGSLVCTDTSTPYSCAWQVPAAGGNRHYQLQAKAFDAAGNIGMSPIVEVIAQ